VASSDPSWRRIEADDIEDIATHMNPAARPDDRPPSRLARLGPWLRLRPARASAGINPVPIFICLAVAACASAPMPTAWTRTDGRATDPPQLESDKTLCRGEMEQAELVTNARGLVAIQLPGQESPSLKVYIGCMARRGYAAVR
jgi:hypothetical protein